MSTDPGGGLGWLEVAGTPHEVGRQLGRFGAAATLGHLTTTHAWASVMAHRGDPRVAAMREKAAARFPAYWQELQGLAEGLGLPFDEVFLWNCRGDLWAWAPDGCTTVQVPGETPLVAHNEDGDPALQGHCALARVQPAGGRSFCAFVYPGSLPGHTFAATDAGLVQTVNNIRARGAGTGLPRMLLGRALLDCGTLDEALRLLREAERGGAFHVTLAQRGDPRLLGVEFTQGRCSVVDHRAPACHANHLVHADMTSEHQIVTASSAARQRRGEALLSAAQADPLALLRDRGDAALPIYRAQSDDPDHENTLATALFRVGAERVEWLVYDGPGGPPRFFLADAECRCRDD